MAATIASNSQDWIASQLSATAVNACPSRTKWTYVQDRNGMMVIEPVLGFYFNPPSDAKCRWSTEKGTRAPQAIIRGLPLPDRVLILWNDDRLESEAARIREKYWDEMKTLVAPQRFEDLYEYFDSATLFMSGAVNLWNLINLLTNDARHNWRKYEEDVAVECDNWVRNWLTGAASNREALIKWDMKSDILTAVTTKFDWDNDLGDLDLVGQHILRECFLHHFQRLTGKMPNVARFNTHAATQKPIAAAAPMIAATGTPDEASTRPDEVPIPSSSAKPLSTIPEESAATKGATKPQGLRIDTGLYLHIPVQTMSAPATAVPRIKVEPQPAREAEHVSEESDGKEQTGDDFSTTQDLAARFQSTARQLSSQSTPAERQDAFLNSTTSNIAPRVVSATDTVSMPLDAHRPQQKLPDQAGTVPRNVCGSKPPFQGPPKSSQDHDPNRQQLPTTMFTLDGERSISQQGVSTRPSQHSMQRLGPQDHDMRPPSIRGVSSNFCCFPHPNTDFQSGVGMEQVSGMNFQKQMRMPLPNMGQSQPGHPQASSIDLPCPYTGQQNVEPPMYQPNGYIPHSQKQLRREKTDKNKQHEDRRDSMTSNGSRNKKVRDDPIHGPVYSLKPAKDSDKPPGRKPTNSDGSVAPDPKDSASNPSFDCLNSAFDRPYRQPPPPKFFDCSCIRCLRSNKSLFVRHEKAPGEQVQAALMQYLGSWGAERVIIFDGGCGSLVVFRSDHDVVRAMRDLCDRPNRGRDIPGLGRVSSLWYAYFSKHYTSPSQNPTGLPRHLWEPKSNRRRSSSTISRDSNAYRNQMPNNMPFNTSSVGNYGPGLPPHYFRHGEVGGPSGLNLVPFYPPPSQRVLWDPNSAEQSRKTSKPESKSKEQLDYQPKTYPKRPDAVTTLREDWRSKPPAEEAIEDISSDEAVADTSSNVSSQGARGVKVCLPNEAGSLRSRSVSPDAERAKMTEQAQKDAPKLKDAAGSEGDQAEGGAQQGAKAQLVAKDDGVATSTYRKATAELVAPVEELHPRNDARQAQLLETPMRKGLTSYSKISAELTDATEDFNLNTVIRHKPPRSPLPEEWLATSEQAPSNLQSRFGALTGAIEQETLGQDVNARVPIGTSDGVATELPKDEQAASHKPKAKKKWPKGAKGKKNKSKASNGTSTSSSVTPTEAQAHGESRDSDNRSTSGALSAQPESAADEKTQSPTRSQHLTKKKNTKIKQSSTAETSSAPDGQNKTEESPDQDPKVSVKGSHTSKLKTQQSGLANEGLVQSKSELANLRDHTETVSVAEQHDGRKESGSGNKEDDPLCTKKDRSPQKLRDHGGMNDERKSLQNQPVTEPQVGLDPPVGSDLNNGSPEANLFPNQKFTIDKVKRDSAKESDIRHRQASALHTAANDARIALPRMPPNSKTSVASRGPRSKSDDPFTSARGEPQEENWLRDKAVRTPQKQNSEPASHQTSPTPSPEKKAGHQCGKNKLNAAAKAFEPTSIPASPAASVASVLSAKAIPFHTKKPSLPGNKSPVEQRLVTPAEQVVDPDTVSQPGPPTKEKKRSGPAPDRGGDGGQKGRVKSIGKASGAATSKKTAAQAAATAPSIASKLEDEGEFPTLAAAATVPQRRASAAIKSSVPADCARSKAATATAPKAFAATPAPKPQVTSRNTTKHEEGGDTTVPAADKQGAGVGEKDKTEKTDEDQWTTVASGKKAGVKKNNTGNSSRTASGKSGGSAAGQGGRAGGQGSRGGKAPVGEERKGG
ncbi:hypothetical protein KVR01_002279 [Diaporthe batatas]|uniref:uncharacterized protein n=1 Tax=Diaporthe batatas TaxID=748121 RepID=UPI001D04A153|nr:uncharacterized protein KVR01_002279 [Diaporthe batatas]KAG8166590.1 hypothetical protein KVR01_002279 [Diaporthe batatas]